MKLKLETQEEITILSVTDAVSAQEGSVLRAGILKLFQTGKLLVIVDLTGATKVDPAALNEVWAAHRSAPEMDAQLVVASATAGGAALQSRDAAIKAMKSVMGNLAATETRLQSRLKKLQARKADIEAKMKAADGGGDDIKTIRKENTELKLLIRELDGQILELLKLRSERVADATQVELSKVILQTVNAVLEKQGILKGA